MLIALRIGATGTINPTNWQAILFVGLPGVVIVVLAIVLLLQGRRKRQTRIKE